MTLPRLDHALEQLRSRYDPEATPQLVEEVERRLLAGDGLRLVGEPDSRSGDGEGCASYLVRIRPGLTVIALFNERDRRLVTFLPPEYIHGQRKRGRRRDPHRKNRLRGRRKVRGRQGLPPLEEVWG